MKGRGKRHSFGGGVGIIDLVRREGAHCLASGLYRLVGAMCCEARCETIFTQCFVRLLIGNWKLEIGNWKGPCIRGFEYGGPQ